MAKLLNKKPLVKNVQGGWGERADAIVQDTNPFDLELGISAVLNTAGQITSFQSDAEVIKTETRTYKIGTQTFSIDGTVYGVGKNETTGKYVGTFFMPKFVEDSQIANEGATKEALVNTFESIKNIYKLIYDMQYWMLPARCLTEVANSGMANPEMRQFIGEEYVTNLLVDDEAKFSRVMFLQYIKGEIQIANELLKMTNGEAPVASYVPSTTNSSAFVTGSEVEEVHTNVKKFGSFGSRLAAHGRFKPAPFARKFGSDSERVTNAGDAALNKTPFKKK